MHRVINVSKNRNHVTNHYKTFRFHNDIYKSITSSAANSKHCAFEMIRVLVRVQVGGTIIHLRPVVR